MHQIASQRIFIPKHGGGGGEGMPRDPPKKLVTFAHSGRLPQTISTR